MLENFKKKHPVRYKYLFTVTTFSKYLALSMLVIFPIISFDIGMKYQQISDSNNKSAINSQIKPIPTPIIINTLNWKTFTNDKFTINYPSDWNVVITPLIGNRAPAFKPNGKDYPVLEAYYSNLDEYTAPCDNKEVKVVVAGITSNKCSHVTKLLKNGIETNQVAQWRTIETRGVKNKFVINFIYPSGNQNIYYESLLNIILQTFKIN